MKGDGLSRVKYSGFQLFLSGIVESRGAADILEGWKKRPYLLYCV